MILQCATFSKSLNPRNIDKSVSDTRIRFQFENKFWISVSGCKLTILPDIQLPNRIVIISDLQHTLHAVPHLHFNVFIRCNPTIENMQQEYNC